MPNGDFLDGVRGVTSSASPATREDNGILSAVASRANVFRPGFRRPRSMPDKNVQCRFASSASFSCDRPRSSRSARTLRPNGARRSSTPRIVPTHPCLEHSR